MIRFFKNYIFGPCSSKLCWFSLVLGVGLMANNNLYIFWVVTLSSYQAAVDLNLPILGWFSIFIIRTSLKSCWNTEEHVFTNMLSVITSSDPKCLFCLRGSTDYGAEWREPSHNKLLSVYTYVAWLHVGGKWKDLRIVGLLFYPVMQYDWCSDNVALNPALHW